MKKSLIFFALTLCLFSVPLIAVEYRDINIYLKFSPELNDYIASFNTHLKSDGLIKKYDLKPFLENHPVHLSLYLTTYNTANLPAITEAVKKLSDELKKFRIKAIKIESSASNFVILDVDNSKLADGSNNTLQIYSDKVVDVLNNLRYKQSVIPAWANAFPDKKKAFELYGSPNVYMQFNPHFSILAAVVPKDKEKEYLADMDKSIKSFSQKTIEAEAVSIGVGYVDSNGQVTEEIASFPLK